MQSKLLQILEKEWWDRYSLLPPQTYKLTISHQLYVFNSWIPQCLWNKLSFDIYELTLIVANSYKKYINDVSLQWGILFLFEVYMF